MRHHILRALLRWTRSISWTWCLVKEAAGFEWRLITEDGEDSGLLLAERDLNPCAVWVETVSPRALGDQLGVDSWGDEALCRLETAAFTLQLMQRRAYRHREQHRYRDFREACRFVEHAKFCLSAATIGGIDVVRHIVGPDYGAH